MAALAVALFVVAAPGLALAHGLHADPNRSLIDYLPLGIEHMMLRDSWFEDRFGLAE